MKTATNWDEYYSKPYKTAQLSRRYTLSRLVSLLRAFGKPRPRMLELGGGNSCFFTGLQDALAPRRYLVADSNRRGVERFNERCGGGSAEAFVGDVTAERLRLPAGEGPLDVCFSVGLIEHFDAVGTAKAIEAHFDALAPGGIALISYPHPTWLYRASRALSEALGLWIFHDERPLLADEVIAAARRHGELLHEEILWPLFFTQQMLVFRKK